MRVTIRNLLDLRREVSQRDRAALPALTHYRNGLWLAEVDQHLDVVNRVRHRVIAREGSTIGDSSNRVAYGTGQLRVDDAMAEVYDIVVDVPEPPVMP